MLRPKMSGIPFGARRKLADLLIILSNNNAYEFHLAGSYYFGVATVDSDVDLYTEYSPDVVKFLLGLGFVPIRLDDAEMLLKYPDLLDEMQRPEDHGNNTFSVFRHESYPVHVQIFFELPLALKARDILAKVFNEEHARTRGEARARMWCAAIDAAREILDADAEKAQPESVPEDPSVLAFAR